METSSAGAFDAKQHVTTFIPQQVLFPGSDDVGMHGNEDDGVGLLPLHPFLRASLSRRRFLLRLLKSWEGRDALFQLLQSMTLLIYALAPVLHSKQRRHAHIASEGLANIRRLIVLGRWSAEGAEALRQALSEKASDNVVDHDEMSGDDSDGSAFNSQNSSSNKSRITSLCKNVIDRCAPAAEYLAMIGDGCEIVSLLGGSGILWRVLGGKLAARQRKGLERVALFFMCLSFILALREMKLLLRQRAKKLRKANERLLIATDLLNTPYEDSGPILLRGIRMSHTEALSQEGRTNTQSEKGSRLAKDPTDVSHGTPHDHLRNIEERILSQRKKIQLLRLERTAIRCELVFVLIEILFPHTDHAALEGWTGLLASLCHMSRLGKTSIS